MVVNCDRGGVMGLFETRPYRNGRYTRTQVTAFSNSSFIHGANVLTVTEVTVTTTIYDTDDTAMLKRGLRLRDRNCVSATVTGTH